MLRLTGYEFLRFIADVYEVPENIRLARVTELAGDFGILDKLNEQINSFSHGMRQKLMVIGALLVDPNVWILDEPLVGLDPKAAATMKQKMRAHADKGHIVLFSTHVLEVAEKLVDRICVINQGKIAFVGTVEELREKLNNNASLEDLFLELTDPDEADAVKA